MVRTQIQLREDQSAVLKAMAADRGVSVAELIRRSIDRFMREQKEPTMEEKWERAMSIIGIANSGLGDLAENHDKYLEEAYAEVGE
jgi:hypothetical protein